MAIARGGTGAQFLAQRDLGHVRNGDRLTVARRNDQATQITNAAHPARDADQQLLLVAFEVTRALVRIVAFHCLHHVFEGQTVGQQTRRIGLHVKLLGVAADGVHLGDAWHLQQLQTDHPILEGAQRSGVVRAAVWLPRIRIGLDGVEKNFTEACRDGPHRGLHPIGQAVTDLLKALVDELAGKIEISPLLERHGYL